MELVKKEFKVICISKGIECKCTIIGKMNNLLREYFRVCPEARFDGEKFKQKISETEIKEEKK